MGLAAAAAVIVIVAVMGVKVVGEAVEVEAPDVMWAQGAYIATAWRVGVLIFLFGVGGA
jgi:hypothetical protein